MPQRWRRYWPWLASAGLALCVLAEAVHAAPEIADPGAFLEQTERVRTSDHPRFVLMLEQMRSEAPQLTSGQRWYLRYLEAWQTAFEGDAPKANSMLRDVIDHSGDITLKAKASALLMHNLGISNHYEEAFTLANQLASELPEVTDKLTRFTVLANLSQLMVYAGQTDLAIKYARMMEDTLPPGETLCNPLSMELSALDKSNRLTSSSPMLQEGIDTCLAAGQPVFANTLRLIKSSLYLNEGQPTKALDLLKRILPSITASRYYSHMRGVQEQLALTYEKLGEDNNARKAALAVLAMSEPDEISEWLRETYDLLYRIEKKRGNLNATLTYYELYAAQDKGYLDDISARSLAYAAVQQHVLAQKLETEGLSKQNSILRLQQALNTKAVETGRLYIALLLMMLVSIVLWLFRIKRSQLRFKKLSCVDGLTGILNHQTFIAEASRALHLTEKKHGKACLIFIDLDHFKQINDTHGHAVGDDMLKHVVTLCRPLLRTSDLFGRLGGEEFGILFVDCGREQGMMLAERVRRTIEASPGHCEDLAVALSASIGMAATDMSGYAMQPLCRDADAALYRAKRGGRNRVVTDNGDEKHAKRA